MALFIGGLTAMVATVTIGKLGAEVSARNFYGILRVMAREDGEWALSRTAARPHPAWV